MSTASSIIAGIIALIVGVVVLFRPSLLRWLVGGYFIILGIIYLVNA